MPTAVPAAPRSDRQSFDGVALLVAPAVLILCALFVYPFAYGLWLSFAAACGLLAALFARPQREAITAVNPVPAES